MKGKRSNVDFSKHVLTPIMKDGDVNLVFKVERTYPLSENTVEVYKEGSHQVVYEGGVRFD